MLIRKFVRFEKKIQPLKSFPVADRDTTEQQGYLDWRALSHPTFFPKARKEYMKIVVIFCLNRNWKRLPYHPFQSTFLTRKTDFAGQLEIRTKTVSR